MADSQNPFDVVEDRAVERATRGDSRAPLSGANFNKGSSSSATPQTVEGPGGITHYPAAWEIDSWDDERSVWSN